MFVVPAVRTGHGRGGETEVIGAWPARVVPGM
jgi:hypothetical protein